MRIKNTFSPHYTEDKLVRDGIVEAVVESW